MFILDTRTKSQVNKYLSQIKTCIVSEVFWQVQWIEILKQKISKNSS